tara:strand:+ start:111 stop:815 length:705 start_codon:yes stop_codon:yes gene_type:complete
MLYIFGDSFSVSKEYFLTTPIYKNNKEKIDNTGLESWIDIVAANLGKEVNNQATIGASNEWIMNLFFNGDTNNFKDDDYIIIQLSSTNRRWFFPDRPHLGNFHTTVLGDAVSDKEKVAIDYYVKYLWNQHADSVNLNILLLALQHISHIINCRMLILPGFEDIGGVTGKLNDVCFGEFDNRDGKIKEFYNTNLGDLRLNHLSPINHKILGEKVSKFFINGTGVDLTTDFHKNIY